MATRTGPPGDARCNGGVPYLDSFDGAGVASGLATKAAMAKRASGGGEIEEVDERADGVGMLLVWAPGPDDPGGAFPGIGDGQAEAEFAVRANLERILRGSWVG